MSSQSGRPGQKLALSQDSQVPMQYQLPTLNSTSSPLLMLFSPLSTQNSRWKHTTENKFMKSIESVDTFLKLWKHLSYYKDNSLKYHLQEKLYPPLNPQ